MMQRSASTLISMAVVLCLFGVLCCPQGARAQWHHREGDLPGLVSTETLIVVGLVTVAVIIIVNQASSKAQEVEGGEYAPPDSTDYSLPDESTIKLFTDRAMNRFTDFGVCSESAWERTAPEDSREPPSWRPAIVLGRGDVGVGLFCRF